MSKLKKKLAGLLCAVMALSCCFATAGAFDAGDAGSYTVDAGLSCYVSAMGGIEFGDGLLQGVTVTVDEDGAASATLSLTKSQVTIYSITCDTFVDAADSAPGYYDAQGALQQAEYTLSQDTALNPSSEQVNYVDSMTIPVSQDVSEYHLWLYVNSQVMGVQFGDGQGTGSSNQPGVATPYAAVLTIDWDSLTAAVEPDETSSQSATVNYTVANTYEVSIPATITVDPFTKTGDYTVEAKHFVLGEGSYVTVTADAAGTLSNGADSVAFDNTLAEGQLTQTGDTLAGTVTVTGEAASSGTYSGTLNFTINFFAGA